MVSSYVRLASHRGVPRLLAVALLTRLMTPVLSLALMLAIVEQTGSYGVASLALTGHALTLGLCAPLAGRLADRYPTSAVLAGFLAVNTVAYLAVLTTVTLAAPAIVLVAAAVMLGASTPPAGSVLRAAWPRIVPTGSLPTAYALDNATNELMFIVGPALVAVFLVVTSAQLIMAVAGLAFLAGAVLLLTAPVIRSQAPGERPTSPRSRLGPLTHRPTLVLLVVAATATVGFGCLRVATVAEATTGGAPGWAGILMSLLSTGTLIGGLLYGAGTRRVSGRRLLIGLSLADAAILLTSGIPTSLPALAVLIAVTGLLQGPRDALQATLLADHAPADQRTEAFAWLSTFMWGGYGLGTAVAGQLTGPTDDGGAAFLAAAAAAVLGALVVTACYRPAADHLQRGVEAGRGGPPLSPASRCTTQPPEVVRRISSPDPKYA